ncbi:MAG: alpha/beta hydrolase [Acidobacteria bacterium]|nr:alpha/beta hydrolase [Acidobacteriota bacterium]
MEHESREGSPERWTRIDSDFVSGKSRCAGWLYLPEAEELPPVVVMAHGFAAERTFGLEPFAERFAAAGLAVFLFDYRCFGDSEGQPRNLVDPFRHLADWRAAIAHVRGMDRVDSNRLGLWGTSFSGGHVIVTAARDGNVRAVSSQVPFVDPVSTFRRVGLAHVLRGSSLALRDLLRAATGRRPLYVPVVAEPGTFATMNTPESLPGYSALVPGGATWRNECPARILLTMSFYRPMGAARKVRCPALVVLAEQDSLIDARAVERTAARMQHARLVRLPVGHFDVYSGAIFERLVVEQIRFFNRHLA